MSDRDVQMESDIARVTKLMRGLVEQMYEESEERGETNFRIDQLGIVGIAVWNEPDSDLDVEDVFTAFESRKHHVVTGILTDTLLARIFRGNRR